MVVGTNIGNNNGKSIGTILTLNMNNGVMKKEYMTPAVEVLAWETGDVLTLSPENGEGNNVTQNSTSNPGDV